MNHLSGLNRPWKVAKGRRDLINLKEDYDEICVVH